ARPSFLHDELERYVLAGAQASYAGLAAQRRRIAVHGSFGDVAHDVHRVRRELTASAARTCLRRERETVKGTGRALPAPFCVKSYRCQNGDESAGRSCPASDHGGPTPPGDRP